MASDSHHVDAMVRQRLSQWPQHPPGLDRKPGQTNAWLRGRPHVKELFLHPYLKLPGSNRYRTLPDGLWLSFGGTPVDAFVDIFAVEACSSKTNLLDKRSRFSPSTHSTLAVCPLGWLLQMVSDNEPVVRWKATGVLREEPTRDLVLPVRDVRVLYGLSEEHYQDFARSQAPHAHEYFVPMAALTAENGHSAPELQALVSRAAVSANFMTPPGRRTQPLPQTRRRSIPGMYSAECENARPASPHPIRRAPPDAPVQAASRTIPRT